MELSEVIVRAVTSETNLLTRSFYELRVMYTLNKVIAVKFCQRNEAIPGLICTDIVDGKS